MKILVYRAGAPAGFKSLPGERPEAEIADLLGGDMSGNDIRKTFLAKGLCLYYKRDTAAKTLPRQYLLKRIGKGDRFITGDCVIAASRWNGTFRDVAAADLAIAGMYLIPLGTLQ